jgi:hypothetical protein
MAEKSVPLRAYAAARGDPGHAYLLAQERLALPRMLARLEQSPTVRMLEELHRAQERLTRLAQVGLVGQPYLEMPAMTMLALRAMEDAERFHRLQQQISAPPLLQWLGDPTQRDIWAAEGGDLAALARLADRIPSHPLAAGPRSRGSGGAALGTRHTRPCRGCELPGDEAPCPDGEPLHRHK